MTLRVVVRYHVFQRPAKPAKHIREHNDDGFDTDRHGSPNFEGKDHVNNHSSRIRETPALTGLLKEARAGQPLTTTQMKRQHDIPASMFRKQVGI
jgi:hypothetical protein